MTSNPSRPIALTGIKPTGAPHIGNLLGAIRPALALTEKYRGVYFIADYHALTTERDGKALRQATLQVAATWMALGLDTEAHVFFKQSDVPEVCELAWILSCFTGMGLLRRGHAFKDADVRVHSARIATFGERAEDFFTVTTQDGQKLDAAGAERVREALLARVSDS